MAQDHSPGFGWPPDHWPLKWQYVLALGLVSAALLVRWLIGGELEGRIAFPLVFSVLLPLGVLVRPGPFLTAGTVGFLGAWLLFLPPRMTLVPADGLGLLLGVFGVTLGATGLTAWLSYRVRAGRQQAEQALREVDRRKDEFLATLSHELRNPLATIRTAAHGLAITRDDPPRVDEIAALIERQSSQIVRLVDELLDVNRISRGRMKLELERVDLAGIVRQAVADALAVCEDQGLTVSSTVPEQPIMVDADPARIVQVVNNLLDNACKFTPTGGEIRVNVEREHREAVVGFADTGIGMTEDQLSGIFGKFTQFERPRASRDGLGLGLSLARSIVELHGGKLEARSDGPGKGSEFLIRLPMTGNRAQPIEPFAESVPRRRATTA